MTAPLACHAVLACPLSVAAHIDDAEISGTDAMRDLACAGEASRSYRQLKFLAAHGRDIGVRVERTAFRLPLTHTPVQHARMPVTQVFEYPQLARGELAGVIVIDDDLAFVTDACNTETLPHVLRKCPHPIDRGIGHKLIIGRERHRPRDMSALEFVARARVDQSRAVRERFRKSGRLDQKMS